MGKDKIPPQPVTFVSTKERGLKVDADGLDKKFWILLGLAVLVIIVALQQILRDPSPSYRPARDLAPVRAAIAYIVAAVILLIALGGGLTLGLSAYVKFRKGMAEVGQIENEAGLIRAVDGLFPWFRRKDGTLQNLNAAPGASIQADGKMDEPETPAQWEAVQRATAVQLAAAMGGRALPGLGLAPRPLPAAAEGPPIRVIEGEKADRIQQALLEGPEED